jgi:hypothetical protein
VVQFFSSGPPIRSIATNSTTTVFVENTNGMAANTTIVIRHYQTDTYERRQISSILNSTNISVYQAPATTVNTTDQVYVQTAGGNIPCGAATLTLTTATGIYSGPAGRPLLIEIDSTSAGQLNSACASFVR